MSESSRRGVGRHFVVDWILFVGVGILFLCSFLVLFSAPTRWLWFAAILVGEWGHYAGVVAILLALLCWPRGLLGKSSAALALVAAVLCFSPMVRAAIISRTLPMRCTAAFGPEHSALGRAQPLAWLDFFRGIDVSGVRVTEHVFGKNGWKSLKLDLYRAKDARGAEPIILMIHGGSWNSGRKTELSAMNRYFAREHYALVSIEYRRTPKWPFPAAGEDVFHAIAFLKAHAAELNLDPTRIVLMGRSAGAQLALSAAYAQKEPAIRGVVSLYGPTDLVLGYKKPSPRWVLDSRQILEEYLGGTPAAKPAAYAAASPVNFVGAATPPTLLIQGDLDPMVWPFHAVLLSARLEQAGRPYLYLRLPWATHGCDANLAGPSGQLSLYAIDRFLAAVFAPDSSVSASPRR